MRHIDGEAELKKAFSTVDGARVKSSLHRARKRAKALQKEHRHTYISNNGPKKWRPVKHMLIAQLGDKCWYTETRCTGAHLVIDHYRPVCDYYWLAFDAANYRVACPFANSPEHNETHGCAGGKGDSFPLMNDTFRATCDSHIWREQPLLLDPCDSDDCALVAFDSTGRPVINSSVPYSKDTLERFQKSLLLLNLDHPDFNAARGRLFDATRDDVETYEELPAHSPKRAVVLARIKERIRPTSKFSSAATYYLRLYRHLMWVDALF